MMKPKHSYVSDGLEPIRKFSPPKPSKPIQAHPKPSKPTLFPSSSLGLGPWRGAASDGHGRHTWLVEVSVRVLSTILPSGLAVHCEIFVLKIQGCHVLLKLETSKTWHLETHIYQPLPHESSEIKPGFFQITVLTMDFFRYLQFSPGFFRDLQVFFQVNPGFCIKPPTSLPWRRSVPWTTVAPAIRAIHLGRCVGPPNVWREMPWPCWITWDGPLGTESFQCQGTGNWELLGFYVLWYTMYNYIRIYIHTHILYSIIYIYLCVWCVCVLDMICTKDMYIFIYGWPSICGISCFFKNVPGSFQGEGAHHWNQHGWHDRAGRAGKSTSSSMRKSWFSPYLSGLFWDLKKPTMFDVSGG